jgi:phosphatidylglycerol:prolipoprotein diacylglycerol transferase
MRRTLFLIPHEIAGIPFFGFGWLLAALGLYVIVRLVIAARTTQRERTAGQNAASSDSPRSTWTDILAQEGIVWAAFAAIIVFVLPRAELSNLAGEPVGLPIRGYGMFLMLAAVTSVSLAAWRAKRKGLGSDTIMRLAPWTFGGGLIGARLFYVVQYHQDFMRDTWPDTIAAMAAFTQGGLVVYGGFIGGFLASAWVVRWQRLPLWKLGDAIVPCIFVGLFFGRLGCLMNGCCYGGACEPNPLSVRFPPGSKIYADQMETGALIGITAEPLNKEQPPANRHHRGTKELRVESVASGSLADQIGIEPGQIVSLIPDPGFASLAPPDVPAEDALPGLAVVSEGELVARFSPDQLPSRADPVLATQVLSSLVAAIMFGVLLILERVLHSRGIEIDGILMLCGFIAYGVLRIVLEWIRVDEAGQFGTGLSISQLVSIGVIAVSVIALAFRIRMHKASPAI